MIYSEIRERNYYSFGNIVSGEGLEVILWVMERGGSINIFGILIATAQFPCHSVSVFYSLKM